ncbi:helix-turn-helix domain-containing protein [Streptomyces maoxianensis]|uniref:Helix-turn-helix domain-containing protein n=1 Tax=Streptomyces maoxianensis TaxID=1459942 RepID=A0ABV9G3A2_9ACTN
MAHDEVLTPTGTIAKRVKEVRKGRGLTAEQLAVRLAEQGFRWDRYTVTKLETGKRQNVTVAELFALGTALNVAPVNLLVPTSGDENDYQVTPAKTATVGDVREWVRGRISLGNGRYKDFIAEAPEGEFVTFDVTTREGAEAAAEWAKGRGLGTVTETGKTDG